MQQIEGTCPNCQQKMTSDLPLHYYCGQCHQHYTEQFICPFCEQKLQRISGCGAVNYICPKDGLVSSQNVKFYYIPE